VIHVAVLCRQAQTSLTRPGLVPAAVRYRRQTRQRTPAADASQPAAPPTASGPSISREVAAPSRSAPPPRLAWCPASTATWLNSAHRRSRLVHPEQQVLDPLSPGVGQSRSSWPDGLPRQRCSEAVRSCNLSAWATRGDTDRPNPGSPLPAFRAKARAAIDSVAPPGHCWLAGLGGLPSSSVKFPSTHSFLL